MPDTPARSMRWRRGPRSAGRLAVLVVAVAGCGGAPGAWEDGDGFRWRTLAPAGGGEPGFTAIDPERAGLRFENRVTVEAVDLDQHVADGAGVAIGDVDGDDLPDVFLARANGPNALYRNLGRWRFQDVTERSGVALADRVSTGAVLVDVEGDGDLDLFVTVRGGPDALFVNDGTGTFRDEASERGVASPGGSTTAAFADVDGDGDLDLYVAHYTSVVGRPADTGEEDGFFLNDGTGRFAREPVAGDRFPDEDDAPTRSPATAWGLAARFHDLDGDLAPDLYVANDFESPDALWLNAGDGRFRRASWTALRSTSMTSMAVDFSDVDRDGDVDFLVVDMLPLPDSPRRKTHVVALPPPDAGVGAYRTVTQKTRNTLQMREGSQWVEMARSAGIAASDWSWGTLFLDVDLDGYEDVLIATGHLWDILDADVDARLRSGPRMGNYRERVHNYPRLAERNLAFRNQGDTTFAEVGEAWGWSRGEDVSHGIATGDLDRDGDLDAIVNRLDDPALILENGSAAPRVAVRLRGRSANTAGVGSSIELHGGPVPQRREMTSGGLYLSSAEATATFAATAGAEHRIVVRWRSGLRSVVEGVREGRLYEVFEAGARRAPADSSGRTSPAARGADVLFEDASDHLDGHAHVDREYDDSRRQPLLLHRLSQLGPGVTWDDVDADGDEDLLVGTGGGGRVALLRNVSGSFRRESVGLEQRLDVTTLLPLERDGRPTTLLVGRSNYEALTVEEARGAAAVVRHDLERPRSPGVEVVAGDGGGTGPLAAADVDGDGSLDLFVGGRAYPAAYPRPPHSRLYLERDGRWVEDERAAAALRGAGLVSGAVFSDVDGDGDPDLVLAVEWGPVRLFLNHLGRLSDVTAQWGLDVSSRWNGVAAGDLDGDGAMDLIATSWGENTEVRATPERPLKLYWGDLDGSGTMDVLRVARDDRLGEEAPLLDFELLTTGLPFVRRRIGSWQEYANASLRDVLGPALASARVESITTLESTAFLNRGGRFEAVPLPRAAQLAPAFHTTVADLNGDGYEDVFLTQNFFPNEVRIQRYDAGRALVLLGDGSGRLEALGPDRSGVAVYGDQRGAAVADFDADGRLDLAVGQNGAQTRLFRNRGARPGLRVRLVGPPSNPRAVGAALRVTYADGVGPAREVHLGGGYWSVDGRVVVLGLSGVPVGVHVRWPGGREEDAPVADATEEIVIRWRRD